MRSTSHNFTMYRGLTWAGLSCIAVDASGDPVEVEGTGLLQARKGPNKDVAFELPVTLGSEQGQILIPEVSAAITAALPAGAFMYDLVMTDEGGKPWPPFLTGLITVRDPISKPPLS